MVFHLGALWRLNELGFLPKLDRISSVSGGSITAGVLGLAWSKLTFDANGVAAQFESAVVSPVRRLAGRTIDEAAVIGGVLLAGSVSDRVIAGYRRRLFDTATLQDLPDRPRFVINATNVQTGALWRFMKPYMADYRVGRVVNPRRHSRSRSVPPPPFRRFSHRFTSNWRMENVRIIRAATFIARPLPRT